MVSHLGSERQTWIHLQEDDSIPFQFQNEIQVAPGDRLQFSFCLHNLNGFVDMATIKCSDAQFVEINENMKDFLKYNRDKQGDITGLKIVCDVDRVCDIEDSVTEWHAFHQQRLIRPIAFDQEFMQYFEVVEVFFNESD